MDGKNTKLGITKEPIEITQDLKECETKTFVIKYKYKKKVFMKKTVTSNNTFPCTNAEAVSNRGNDFYKHPEELLKDEPSMK